MFFKLVKVLLLVSELYSAASEGKQKTKMKMGNRFVIHSELFLELLILEYKGSKIFRNVGRRNRTTRCHVPQDLNPQSNRCDNHNPVVYFLAFQILTS